MIKLTLQAESLNFWWMVNGFKDWNADGPFRVSWEDLYYAIIKDGVEVRGGGTTLESKAFARYELESVNGDLGDRMELKFPGYKEEERNTVIVDGLTWQGLIDSNEDHFQYSYDEVLDPEKYEIKDMINLPYNEFGMAPCYISMWTPEEWVTKELAEKYMRIYVEKFFGYIVDEIEWIEVPEYEYLKKEYDDGIKQSEEWVAMRAKGEKFTVKMLPQVMGMFVDQEIVDKWVARGLKTAEHMEDMEDMYILEFEDGHTEISSETPEMMENNENNE